MWKPISDLTQQHETLRKRYKISHVEDLKLYIEAVKTKA